MRTETPWRITQGGTQSLGGCPDIGRCRRAAAIRSNHAAEEIGRYQHSDVGALSLVQTEPCRVARRTGTLSRNAVYGQGL